MVIKSVRDVGLFARIRVESRSGIVVEDRVIAKAGELLVTERGTSVDPRKQTVKVIASAAGNWRANEGGGAYYAEAAPAVNLEAVLGPSWARWRG